MSLSYREAELREVRDQAELRDHGEENSVPDTNGTSVDSEIMVLRKMGSHPLSLFHQKGANGSAIRA